MKERAAALALAVNRAGREAIVSGQTIALGIRDGQPIFQRRRAGKWMDEPALLPLSQGADGNRLEVSGAVNSPRSGFPAASADDQVQRVAWFSPLGEATPVELLVIGEDGSAAVRVETNGRARVLDSREETSDVRSLGR